MTKLGDIGEDSAISWISEFLGKPRGVTVPVGDDAAVIPFGDSFLTICTDMIQEGIHIYPGMTPFQTGRKAAVVNFSDLASMGASPKGFLLSLGVGKNYPLEAFKEIFRGAESACREAGAKFLGGDMNSSEKLILDGVAFGEIKNKDDVMRRGGAKDGDIVAVTGPLGGAACGWQILTNNLDLTGFSPKERGSIEKWAIGSCRDPKARVKEGKLLARSGGVTSCTDISDGLAYSLGYMSKASSCGFEIIEERVPVREATKLVCTEFDLDLKEMTYNIGEDFELLCTIRKESWKKLKKKLPCLTEIGRVVPGKEIRLIGKGGKISKLEAKGYNHFNQS